MPFFRSLRMPHIPFSWTDARMSLFHGVGWFALIFGGLWLVSFTAPEGYKPAVHTLLVMGLWAGGVQLPKAALRRLVVNLNGSRVDLSSEHIVSLFFGVVPFALSSFFVQTGGFHFIVHIFVCVIISWIAVCVYYLTKIVRARRPSPRASYY